MFAVFAVLSVAAFVTLWLVTRYKIRHHMNPDWYAGFGQWLGALATFIAAVVALVIATTDRRRTDRQRRADKLERDKDLLREAGLVRVETGSYESPFSVAVLVRNHRATKIFDIQLFVDGSDEPYRVPHIALDGRVRKGESLPYVSVAEDKSIRLALFGSEGPARVAVQYTDLSGRRWEVTSEVDDQRNARKITD